jgi:hypothetical protein
MKLIIAGSRNFKIHHTFLHNVLNFYLAGRVCEISEVVSGGASGIDFAAKRLCESTGPTVYDKHFFGRYKEFPAEWDKHGKAAGPIRNKEMAEYADALLLIWDGDSKGSANMKKEMLKLNKPIYEVILKNIKLDNHEIISN